MPFTYSIAYGLITGIITYVILNTGAWFLAWASKDRIIPHDYEQKDYWTYKVRGGLLPGWVKRLAKGKRDFWREWDFDAEELTSRDSYVTAKKRRESGMSTDMATMQTVVTNDRLWEVPDLATTAYGNKTDVNVSAEAVGVPGSSRAY